MNIEYKKINLRNFRQNLTQLKDSLNAGQAYEVIDRGKTLAYFIPSEYEVNVDKKTKSAEEIEKSEINFNTAAINKSKYRLFRSDIKDVALNKKNVDKIISNLPFGIRVGKHSNNVEIYKSLEVLANRLLRTRGKLVLLTQEKKLLREVFSKENWNVKSVLRVDEGGLLPEVFVIERKV